MEPIHALEYEFTSELATDIQRSLLRFTTRRGWRRDWKLLLGWLVFASLLAWPVVTGWWSPGLCGAILFVVTLYVLGALYNRRWQNYAAAATAVAGLYTTDRRVRLAFHASRVVMETEFVRGESAWTELDEVVMFPNFWALLFANGGQVVIPIESMTAELKTFLEAKAQEHEARVMQEQS